MSFENEIFLENRLIKRQKHLKKWARKNGIFAYRLYDKDIPEFPLCIDLFEDAFDQSRYSILTIYKHPEKLSKLLQKEWVDRIKRLVSKTLELSENNIFLKIRERKKELTQYEKIEEKEKIIFVKEHNNLFKINLSNYIDTGLFLDHRNLRQIVKNEAKDKDILNLFCYTASFSLHAASNGAKSIDSVDLSNTYLEWAKENFSLNKIDTKNASFIKSDVFTFLKKCKKKYDIIILDPPTFSNSKSTPNVLDINRDYPSLIEASYNLLKPHGILYFSSNSKSLKFDKKLFSFAMNIKEISNLSIGEDFVGKKPHQAWKIIKAE